MLNQSNSQNALLSRAPEIIRRIEEKSVDSLYIYRGEPARHLKICSSLYREYQDIKTDSFNIEIVQEELLTEAKNYTEERDDFKILMDIQRYGGKTNLIEFTTDYLIALFFACAGFSNKDGRVILQKIAEVKDIIYYPPSKPHSRASIQKIVFIRPPKGFIQPNVSDVITIPHNLKQSILDYLQKAYGISTKTIYNDLYGFVMTNNIHHSTYTEYHRGLTWQHRGIEASTSEEKQNAFEKAIRHYTEALALKTDDPDIYYNRGLAHFNIDEYNNAISDYTKAIELKPDYADAYYHRGLTYVNSGQYDNAISDYTKAIELKPDYADAYYHRGLTYVNSGQYDNAISDYTKVIELKPDYVDAYHHRGLTYASKGETDLSILDYNTVIDLDPNNSDAYFHRSFAYRVKGKIERARADYNKYMELRRDDILEQGEIRGFLHSMKLRFDEAISGEPYYRIFAVPMTLVSDAVRTQEPEIHNLLRNPPDVRKGAFGFIGIPEVLPIPDGISGLNLGEGEVILLNNGFLELRCPLSDSVFQWQISAYEKFWDSEWLYPYVVCEFPVTFLRLVKAIYTTSHINFPIIVQQEYRNLNGFLLVGRHPGNPKFGIFENERRVYESNYPIVSTQTVSPNFSPDQIAYDFVTDVYTHFGLTTTLMPDLFDEKHNFVL